MKLEGFLLRHTKSSKVQSLTLERIYRLFEEAEKAFSGHPERSKRYVEMARKLSTRNKATIPRELKNRFCKKCGTYLEKGTNAAHSIQNGMRMITCKECGYVRKTRAK